MDDEIIILNVGGVKFETTRNSLIAHPETTLGNLFNPKNSEALKPIYPGEYYRTGEILWDDELSKSKEFPVSKRAIDLEIEYFKIPINSEKRAARNLQQGVTILDKFCAKLIPFINEAINRFVSEVSVSYWETCDACSCEPFSNYENGDWYKEFMKQGCGLLKKEKVVNAIEKRLKSHFPSIKVNSTSSLYMGSHYNLVISDFLDMDSILENFE
ncbi:10088_t:CDS:2 [Racocetra fulgida]|uniref:10088_t:CDS:1 n=1 Tax=Racocetra fulgida TaxID=60492 RepID=A0A9N9EX79_9GLOM|nr:10088_t:CDS:2 [Racocetra fulgida]